MLKVMTIVGTRPEIIRLSCIIPLLDQHCQHVLVHTGQNHDYTLNQVFFDDLGLRAPDHFLNAAQHQGGPMMTVAHVLIGIDPLLELEKPDAVLVLGDTNSALATYAAKRRKIPIFHMEAGNRCFDQRVPEEINRRMIDHLADINLTYSSIARDYLIRENFPPDQIIKTGSPMREVIEKHKSSFDASCILDKLGLTQHAYYVVSAHREENVDHPDQLDKFCKVLDGLASHDLPVIVSTHPRTRNKLNQLSRLWPEHVRFCQPFGFFDYVHLQIHAKAVLSDSGTITEEASILNFPALNLRDAHERPEGFEEAAVMMTGMSWPRIEQALTLLSKQPKGTDRLLNLVEDYAAVNVSEKVLRILISYTNFIKRKVWHIEC